MKITLRQLFKNPNFVYLFDKYTLELNEVELAILGLPSSTKPEEAKDKFISQGPRNLK